MHKKIMQVVFVYYNARKKKRKRRRKGHLDECKLYELPSLQKGRKKLLLTKVNKLGKSVFMMNIQAILSSECQFDKKVVSGVLLIER